MYVLSAQQIQKLFCGMGMLSSRVSHPCMNNWIPSSPLFFNVYRTMVDFLSLSPDRDYIPGTYCISPDISKSFGSPLHPCRCGDPDAIVSLNQILQHPRTTKKVGNERENIPAPP
jgi:hypothetical protein